jgi:hypothetical protein
MSSKLVSSRNGGDGVEASKATGGGPAGGISYPSLQVTVGAVTALPSGTTPTVTNTGQYDTAVLNFGLPQGPVGPIAIVTSPTPPASPVTGMVWFDETTLRTYVRYDNAWVETTSSYTYSIGNVDGGTPFSTY